jgi:hypothetical protein
MNNNTELQSVHRKMDGPHVNKPNLLPGPPCAKSIPSRDPVVQKMVDTVMALSPRYGLLKSALKQYLVTNHPLDEIAVEHSYTGAALKYWVKKLGFPRRRRERRVFHMPTAGHQRAMAVVREYGVAEIMRPKRHRPLSVVVSFRVSPSQWARLLATKPSSDGVNLSGGAKARAIVLDHIGSPNGHGPELAKVSDSPAPETTNIAD